MTATRPPAGDVAALGERPQRRVPRTRSAIEAPSSSQTISTLAQALAEAERRAAAAERELDQAGAETQRLGTALDAVRDECARIQASLPAIEETARGLLQRGEEERDGLGTRLRRLEQERCELAARLCRREQELGEVREQATATIHAARERSAIDIREAQERAEAAILLADEQASAAILEARESAAAAILLAEERAAAAMRGVHVAVDRLRVDGEDRVSEAHADADARVREAYADVDARVREAHIDVDARVREAQLDAGTRVELALQDERELRTAAEAHARHLEAELVELRRTLARQAAGPSEGELVLRAELDRADGDMAELRTRLALCVHALRERENELEGERKLADEAAHWASRVERSLVRDEEPVVGGGGCGGGHVVQRPVSAEPERRLVRDEESVVGGGGDVVLRPASTEPASTEPAALQRRRGPRLRVRPGS